MENTLGQILKNLRQNQSFPQEFVRRMLGHKNVHTLSKIENNDYIPNSELLEQLFKIYQCSYDQCYKIALLSFNTKLPDDYKNYLRLIEKYSLLIGKKDTFKYLDESKIEEALKEKYSSIYNKDTAKILSSKKMFEVLNKLTQVDESKREQALDTFLILLKGIE